MASIEERAARAAKIASVLRPLGNGVLSRQQAERAAQLLGPVHILTSGPKAQASEAKAR